jgi:hypothetical protein
MSVSTTSRTACWNSVSPLFRFRSPSMKAVISLLIAGFVSISKYLPTSRVEGNGIFQEWGEAF